MHGNSALGIDFDLGSLTALMIGIAAVSWLALSGF
jgi:hypothetical protein